MVKPAKVYCVECRTRQVSDIYDAMCARCANEVRAINGQKPVPTPSDVLERRIVKYGLSPTDYHRLWQEQGQCCAICRRVPVDMYSLVVDHNHATNEVRGLLCVACNTGIGLLQDNPDVMRTALKYLEERGYYGTSEEE